jgi:hypothetical protein
MGIFDMTYKGRGCDRRDEALLYAMGYESDLERTSDRGHNAQEFASWSEDAARIELVLQVSDLREECLGQGRMWRWQMRFFAIQLWGVLLLLFMIWWRLGR